MVEKSTQAATPVLRLKSLEELEAGLIELARVYATCPEQAGECRRAVIKAKDRARLASRNLKAATDKRALKAEMVEWMLVWLGDPAMFETWVRLRKTIYCRSIDST